MDLTSALTGTTVNGINKPELGRLVKFYGSRTSYELEFGTQANSQIRNYDNEDEFLAAVDALVSHSTGSSGGQSNTGILRTNALRLENFYNELAKTANEVVDTLVGEFNCTATDIVAKAQEIKAELLTLTVQLDEEKRVSTETRAELDTHMETIRGLNQQILDLSGSRTGGQSGGQTSGQSGGRTGGQTSGQTGGSLEEGHQATTLTTGCSS